MLARANKAYVKTPYGDALQEITPQALRSRVEVENGAKLYRIGTTGKSEAASAQFWALESPTNTGFSAKYGIPAQNVDEANFIQTATLKKDANFITRTAPSVGNNQGGGLEVVVEEYGIVMQSFSSQ